MVRQPQEAMKRILEVRVNENIKSCGCIPIVSHLVFSLHHCLEGNPRNQEPQARKGGCSISWYPDEDSEQFRWPVAWLALPSLTWESWPQERGNTSIYSNIH